MLVECARPWVDAAPSASAYATLLNTFTSFSGSAREVAESLTACRARLSSFKVPTRWLVLGRVDDVRRRQLAGQPCRLGDLLMESGHAR